MLSGSNSPLSLLGRGDGGEGAGFNKKTFSFLIEMTIITRAMDTAMPGPTVVRLSYQRTIGPPSS